MIYLGLILTFVGMKTLSPFESSSDFAKFLKPRLSEKDVVAILSSPDTFSDFPFQLRRRVVIVGTDRGTLGFPSQLPNHAEEARAWFLSLEDFLRLFRSGEKRVFCLIKEKDIPSLKSQGFHDYTVLKEGYGKQLISNERV